MFKKSLTILAMISFILIAFGARAGVEGEDPFSLKDQNRSGVSLLDPQRLSLSHSYGLYFSSGRGTKSLALYRSSIRYHLAQPLTVNMDLGYVHSPFKGDDQGRFFIPHLGIEYKPNRFFDLRISISRGSLLYPPMGGGR